MSQQLHIRLDDRVYASLTEYATATNMTRQDCVTEALASYLTKKTREKKNESAKFRFIDLFAGIGGMRIAFERHGGECVFSSEWDRYCQRTYFENFGVMPHGDITKINEYDIPDHEILAAGFPCQPFSIAGVSKKNSLGRETGFLDKTQGTLFFDVVRIINAKRPRAFLLENVKNLKSHDRGKTWKVIMETLDELNYEVFTSVLDGQLFTPQHRERIFIVGFDRLCYGQEVFFSFPVTGSGSLPRVKDILEDTVDDKYTLTNHLWQYLQDYAAKHQAKGNGFGYGLVDLNGVTRTLSARYYKDGSEILIPQDGKNPRRLTPRECARLQGYRDDFKIPVSDTQAYKQFGNSVVVPLVSAVAEKIVSALDQIRHLQISESELRKVHNG
jgi:DNA (cytosine-5)-methyltransferase 1